MRVRLDRPEVKNAFNSDLIDRLIDTFRDLPGGTRAVIISGEGDTFCAGGDLNWMREAGQKTPEQNRADALRLAHLFQTIQDLPVVVITVTHGACFGGGCGLVAAADVAIAAEGTRFSFSEVKLGLIPATISPFVLPKIGAGHARHLFATGEVFDAQHARFTGLVHDVVPPEAIDAAVEKRLKHVLSAGPNAVRKAKELAKGHVLDLDEAATLLAEVRSSEEAQEGLSAFLEKRKATFVEER